MVDFNCAEEGNMSVVSGNMDMSPSYKNAMYAKTAPYKIKNDLSPWYLNPTSSSETKFLGRSYRMGTYLW